MADQCYVILINFQKLILFVKTLENAKKNLVFHFGGGRQASFYQIWSVKPIYFKIDYIDLKGRFVNLFNNFSPLCGAPRPADRSNGLFFRRKLVQGCWLEAVQPDTVVSAAWSSSRELIVRRCKSAQCNTTQWADSRKISQSAENRLMDRIST